MAVLGVPQTIQESILLFRTRNEDKLGRDGLIFYVRKSNLVSISTPQFSIVASFFLSFGFILVSTFFTAFPIWMLVFLFN